LKPGYGIIPAWFSAAAGAATKGLKQALGAPGESRSNSPGHTQPAVSPWARKGLERKPRRICVGKSEESRRKARPRLWRGAPKK
jgi:hypothetical protein